MKTPAEKCAERICNEVGRGGSGDVALVTSIIQSEYAETFKVAREAITAALDMETNLSCAVVKKLRTAMALMTPPQQGIKTMGEMK